MEGLVTLKALVDNKIQSVKAVLDQATYSLAVQAHDRRLPVIVRGDLERVGQRWQLTNGELIELPDMDAVDDENQQAA